MNSPFFCCSIHPHTLSLTRSRVFRPTLKHFSGAFCVILRTRWWTHRQWFVSYAFHSRRRRRAGRERERCCAAPLLDFDGREKKKKKKKIHKQNTAEKKRSGRRLDGCWCFCCCRTPSIRKGSSRDGGKLFLSFSGPWWCCFMIILWYTAQIQLEIMMEWKVFLSCFLFPLFFFSFGMRRRIFPCCLTARTPTATGIVGMDRKVCWVGRGEKVWASCFTKPDGLFMGDFSVKGPHFRIFFFFLLGKH